MSSSAPSSSRHKPSKKHAKGISAPSAPTPAPPARAASPSTSSSSASEEDEDAPPRTGRAGSESSEIDEEVGERRAEPVEGVKGKKRKSYSAFRPPIGVEETKAPVSFASSPFEWDALANKEGVELWAIRMPLGMKPSRLSDLVVHVPPRTSSDPHPAPRGSLKTSKASYSLQPAASSGAHAPSTPAAQPTLADDRAMQVDPEAVGRGAREAADLQEVAGAREGAKREEQREEEIRDELMRSGGEEMAGLRLMLPRMSKEGNLFVAPKRVTQHLILLPSTDGTPAPSSDSILHPSASDPTLRPFPNFTSLAPAQPAADSPLAHLPSREGKRAQPMDKLKRRNMPFGSGRAADTPAAAAMRDADADGDVTMGDASAPIDDTPRKKKHKKHAISATDAPADAKKKHKHKHAA